MKELSFEKMERIEGGAWEGWGSRGCNDAMIGLGVAVVSSFAGPAGIVTGLAGFASFVNHIGDCSAKKLQTSGGLSGLSSGATLIR